MGLGKYIWTGEFLDLKAISVLRVNVKVTDTLTDNTGLSVLGQRVDGPNVSTGVAGNDDDDVIHICF